MKAWRSLFPVALMCGLFDVSRSGFYAWLDRRPSRRQREDERLKVALRAAHKRTRETYGTRRLRPELATDGFVAGRDRIARARRDMGRKCKQKRCFKATMNSNHALSVAEILLDQQFSVDAPNQTGTTGA